MKILGKVSLVSGATFLSRILGLIRDILFFSIFGTSIFGEAFLLAFTFPNLFRRMLGEGTLTSALIPSYTSVLKKEGQEEGFSLLNQVFSRLLVFLGILTLVICCICWFCLSTGLIGNEKWVLGAQYTTITFGYVLLVCCSAILIGILNVHDRFLEGAISPVILNGCMIVALAFGFSPWLSENHQIAQLLCYGVVFAGILQLAMPWLKLNKSLKWKWSFSLEKSDEFIRLSKLFWVGALGAAVAQLNIFVSRLLAYSLEEEGALAFLYLSARLVELPLGVFAISVTTVLFPLLARSSEDGEAKDFETYFYKGVRVITAISIPASVGLCLLAEPIMQLLYQWKEFDYNRVVQGAEVLEVVAWTIPIYAISLFLVKVHHSRKDMKAPLRAALVSLGTNFLLSLLLMGDYGVFGLAWANLISAFCQTAILLLNLSFFKLKDFFSTKKIALVATTAGCLIMALFLYYCQPALPVTETKIELLVKVLFLVFSSILIYGLALGVMKFPEMKLFLKREKRQGL